MGIERERGISVVTSVMTFEYGGCVFNLLDTPGHEDFSEDTYRTLTAVDSAVMVIDAAKGIEARTRKLFEVCRLRDIPIITFINKMDREARDPIELLDEVASTLALDTCPVTWPIGRASEFAGTCDLRKRQMHLINDLPQPAPRLQAVRTRRVAGSGCRLRAALPQRERIRAQRGAQPGQLGMMDASFGAAAAGASLAAGRNTLSVAQVGALQQTFVTGLHAAFVVCAVLAGVGVVTALVRGKDTGASTSLMKQTGQN